MSGKFWDPNKHPYPIGIKMRKKNVLLGCGGRYAVVSKEYFGEIWCFDQKGLNARVVNYFQATNWCLHGSYFC